jgi:hypothetical protein
MKKLFLLVLLVAATPAYAAPADRKAVMDLMRLVIPESSYTAMVDQMSTQMLGQLKQSGAAMPADAPKRLKEAVLEVVPYEEQLGWAADIYQQKFTNEEIADLRKFYETPTGKKAARLLPEIMGEVGKRSGQLIPARIGPALKKHGLVP